MIDYNYPIIAEMKKLYRHSRYLQEMAWQNTRSRGFTNQDLADIFERALSKMDDFKLQISGLRKKIKEAPDISEEDKNSYEVCINNHIENIKNWMKRAAEGREQNRLLAENVAKRK